MKIGILTLPPHANYGGILQTYALQTVLKMMGHDVFLIRDNRCYSLPLWKTPLSYTKRAIKKYVLRRPNARIFYEQDQKVITQHTRSFVEQYITSQIDKKDISKQYANGKLDAIVVGSDQVWRPKYFYGNIKNAYLAFAEKWNIKRIAYAVSFGSPEWEYTEQQTKSCKKLVHQFDAVSTREDQGVVLCKQYLNIDAQHVLDPTMLLSKEDYIPLFDSFQLPKDRDKFLVYFLDQSPEKEEIIEYLSRQINRKPFIVNQLLKETSFSQHAIILPPVEQWLKGFYESEFVLTDSFHGCVFSILFNKPFIVIGNKNRGMARFHSLLKQFGLEEQLAHSLLDVKNRQHIFSGNWDHVNSGLLQAREQSNEFLRKALNK